MPVFGSINRSRSLASLWVPRAKEPKTLARVTPCARSTVAMRSRSPGPNIWVFGVRMAVPSEALAQPGQLHRVRLIVARRLATQTRRGIDLAWIALIIGIDG